MTDRNTEIDINVLHQAIVDAIAAEFPDLETVEDHTEARQQLRLPAVLIELTALEPAPDIDPGTEQLAVLARYDAHVIIGFKTPQAKREIRRLTSALAAFIHGKRWGQPVAPAEIVDIVPDDFNPALDRYECWLISWQQAVHLGASVWNNDGTLPVVVLASIAPEIGLPHEYEYQVVAGTMPNIPPAVGNEESLVVPD
jgi:hypothetical protein